MIMLGEVIQTCMILVSNSLFDRMELSTSDERSNGNIFRDVLNQCRF